MVKQLTLYMSTNLNKTPRTFLWLTIYNRLLNQGVEPHDVDIRYLGKMDRRISKMLSKIYAYPLFLLRFIME